MSIVVQNLIKRYGAVTVVHGISFQVARGEFVSLLGPSGCGKTTTLRCIAGLEDASGGLIKIGDDVVSAPEQGILTPPHERNIGMVFQSYAIWPHMSVAQNVGFPLTIRKVPAAEVTRQVDEALEIVGMRHLRDRQPSQLSGGPSSASRRFCCSTSRSPTSTRSCARAPGPRSAACSGSSAWPPST
jgi:ABC-type sugar transport system ATPase subunit